jgi:hypothetical protein
VENCVSDILSLALREVVIATEDSQLVHDAVIAVIALLEHAVIRPEIPTQIPVWQVLERQPAAAPVGQGDFLSVAVVVDSPHVDRAIEAPLLVNHFEVFSYLPEDQLEWSIRDASVGSQLHQ